MTLVLASKSAARRALLSGAGVAHQAVVSGVDEEAAKADMLARGLGPAEVADALAELKSLVVSGQTPGLVIGADQTLDLDGKLYDKAESFAEARARLTLLRGRTHRLHSAVVLAEAGQVVWRERITASLTMRAFSDAFLDDYLLTEGEAALGSVGCYRLEGPGAQLFSRIEGDYFAVLGLPLMGLLAFLRDRGEIAS